jgi:sulfhydrogenase subunit beta (sulfur reductase)
MSNTVVLDNLSLTQMLERTLRDGRVLAPVRRGKTACAFAWVEPAEDIELDYVRTILPPKKAFLPPREMILDFQVQPEPSASPVLDTAPFVLLGVHPCDLAGIARLDWALGRNGKDPHYFARRTAATIVGIDCMPDEHCFCTSVGTDRARDGADLFLTPIEGGYLAEVLTPKGEALVAHAPRVWRPSPEEQSAAQMWAEERARRVAPYLGVDASSVPDLLERHYDSEAWERIAERCCSCGVCTMVCPTCYCFDVDDEMNLARTAGSRQREWDSCQFADFALVAGPHNFREGRTSRVRHRVMHKFGRVQRDFGAPLCTGCGRCAAACVAGISPTDVVGLIATEEGMEVRG